jgi:hypothetical protein
MHGFTVNESIFNQLIRVYAGATIIPNVPHEHVDMYVRDGFELFNQMVKDSDFEPNIHVLNSLTLLFCNALKVTELEQKVLPLYAKNRI